jgi:hypothetical protein
MPAARNLAILIFDGVEVLVFCVLDFCGPFHVSAAHGGQPTTDVGCS